MLGAKRCNLDAKLRLTLPADFRKELGDKVCLIPFHDCLYGFAPESYEAWVASLFERDGRHFDPRSREDVRLKRGISGSTVMVDVDAAGRIALGKLDAAKPGRREALGLVRGVTVVGNTDHFEVWNTERWEAEQESFEEDFESLLYHDAPEARG